MVLGIDLGGSAVKIAVLDGDNVEFTAYITNSERPAEEVVAAALEKQGYAPDRIALTGVGAAVFDAGKLGFAAPVRRVLEIEAISAGTAFLTGLSEHLTVSIGTGTAFVLTKGGAVSHIGGSAFGGGALQALFKKILGTGMSGRAGLLCRTGKLQNVDLLMSELPSCPPSLDPAMTAANLAKTGPDTTDADWALGLLNMVMQTIGSMAYLTSRGLGVGSIVFTGGPTAIQETRGILGAFTRIYGLDYIVPEGSECATAIGAASLAEEG